MRLKTFVTLFTGVTAVSFASIFIRFADAPPLVMATYRLIIASAVLAPFAARRPLKSLRPTRRDVLLILLSSLFLALHFGLWITSLSLTSIASSVILVTSHPAFIAVASYFLWGEKLRKTAVTGITLALLGVISVNYGDFTPGTVALPGNAMAILASLAMGAYLIIGREIRARIDALSYLTLIYTLSGIMLLLASVLSGQAIFGYSPFTYAMLALLGLVPQLIGHSCINIAVRSLPVTLVSVAILGEPVGATILGIVFLREIPRLTEVLGGMLIITGIYLVSRGAGATRKVETPES